MSGGVDPDVLVIGGGVIGLSSAIMLAEAGYATQVVSRDPVEATTSMVAAALLGPVVPGPDERANRWSQVGYDTFVRLARDAPASGVRICRGRLVNNLGADPPPWASELPGFARCTPDDHPPGFLGAFWADLPVADMRRYLPYLVARAGAAGVRISSGTVASLEEAGTTAGVVVNCSGAGARELVPDPELTSVRGQHVVVRNPGLETFCYEGGAELDWTGYFPHDDRVLLGGIARPDDWSTEPDPEVTAEILRRCIAVEPQLAHAEVLGVEVGLRPGRSRPRVEAATLGATRVVHNYGHGGVGVMLSWACAAEVVDLVG